MAADHSACSYYALVTACPWARQQSCQVSLSHFSAGRAWPALGTARGPKDPGHAANLQGCLPWLFSNQLCLTAFVRLCLAVV